MIRPAAATRSGVSLMVMALVAAVGARRRASTTMRSTSTVSLRSALLRKKVRTISSSYSRRLAAVSGTIATVRGAVTRQKWRVLEASEVRA